MESVEKGEKHELQEQKIYNNVTNTKWLIWSGTELSSPPFLRKIIRIRAQCFNAILKLNHLLNILYSLYATCYNRYILRRVD